MLSTIKLNLYACILRNIVHHKAQSICMYIMSMLSIIKPKPNPNSPYSLCQQFFVSPPFALLVFHGFKTSPL